MSKSTIAQPRLAHAAALALVLALASPTSAATPKKSPEEATKKGSGDAGEVLVELVDEGKGKKAPLRYSFRKGRTEKLQLASRVRMAVEFAGRKMPEQTLPVIEFHMKARTKAIDKDGNAAIALEVTSVQLADQGALPDEMAGEFRKAMSKLEKLTGSMKLTPRGELLDVSLDRSKVKDPGLAPMLASFEGMLAQATIPLPEPAVGVGAKWRSEQDVDVSGATLRQKVEFELKKRKGKTFELGIDVSVASNGKPQRVSLPGAPPGVIANVVKASGDGKGTIDVTEGAAVASSQITIDTRMDITVAAKAGAPTRKMTMSMKSKTTVERKD